MKAGLAAKTRCRGEYLRRLDVEVWSVNLDRARGDASVLSTSERARATRLKRSRDRTRSLKHILQFEAFLRKSCSSILGRSNLSWAIPESPSFLHRPKILNLISLIPVATA
jgi:hypothetical protein